MRSLERLAARLRRSSPVRPLVLLALGDETPRATYAYALATSGFDVALPEGAAISCATRPEKSPDVVLVDVRADGSYGWMFVQALKRDRGTSDIPIVAVAADAGPATRDRARREGCAAVCLMTCPPDLLASGLRAVLERV
jgi:CheY-like chemotaxis protein